MIAIKIDANGGYNLIWPRTDQEILNLASAYVAQESRLPAAQRVASPSLALVQTALTQAQAPAELATQAERDRVQAAEAYRQAMVEVNQRVDVLLVRLKNQYLSNLGQLAQWGLEVVSGKKGATVRKPKGDKALITFLQTYVARESSLPAAQQIQDPALATISNLLTQVTTSQTERLTGRNKREAGVQTRSEKVQMLLDLVQTAGLVLVMTQFQGVVTNDLQAWGFQVVAKSSKPAGIEKSAE
jgi:hypothetical protein